MILLMTIILLTTLSSSIRSCEHIVQPSREMAGWLAGWLAGVGVGVGVGVAENLKLRNAAIHSKTIFERGHNGVLLGKTSYSMIFIMERHMGITAETHQK